MMSWKKLIAISVLSLWAQGAYSQSATDKSKSIAQFMCNYALGSYSYRYSDRFAQSFINAVPEANFRALMKEVVEAVGTCSSYQKISGDAQAFVYAFKSRKSNSATLSLYVDAQQKISGLYLTDIALPSQVANNWQDVAKLVKGLAGYGALSVQSSAGNGAFVNEKVFQPTASMFKLYVLGELADEIRDGQWRWTDQFPLLDQWKSLPSGVMQTWPAGTMISLYDYATYMIQISDNTATDHLMHIMGRENVENQLRIMGNSFIDKNQPLLTTAEMFKIKWATPKRTISSFLASSVESKRSFLENQIANTSWDNLGTTGVATNAPSYIRSVEWFASTNDMCNAILKLREKNSEQVMAILNQNVPFVDLSENSHWNYGGFKGGSEPGVFTMTYLLQSKNNNWGCVSLAWNNEKKNLNQWIYFDLLKKVLKLAEQEI